MTVPDDALTAVTRRPQTSSGAMKAFALLVGLVSPLCAAAAGYFAYRQARVETGQDTARIDERASAGYRTLVDPVDLAIDMLKAHERRIYELEAEMRECQAKASLSTPPATPAPATNLAPLVRLRPLPKALADVPLELK